MKFTPVAEGRTIMLVPEVDIRSFRGMAKGARTDRASRRGDS